MSQSLLSVALENVAPGSVLAAAVHRTDGMLILAAGMALAEHHLERLRGLGITEVVIAQPIQEGEGAAASISVEERQQIERSKVNQLFRKSEDDRVTREFFQAVLDYRLEKNQ